MKGKMVVKLKKCHKWIDYFRAHCPHCRESEYYEGEATIRLVLWCKICGKQFEIGKQRISKEY